MSDKRFYHLHSTGMEPCSITDVAYQHARKTWLCPGCATPKPGTQTIDVSLEKEISNRISLTFVNGCGVPVVNRRFLMSLGAETVAQDLFLGKVYGPKGNLLVDWVTFQGRRRVIVRGSKNISHRRCDDCGRQVYFAMGKRYLFPSPNTDASIHQSDLFGLVVTPDVMARVTINRWPRLDVEELKVFDKPNDKLPELE